MKWRPLARLGRRGRMRLQVQHPPRSPGSLVHCSARGPARRSPTGASPRRATATRDDRSSPRRRGRWWSCDARSCGPCVRRTTPAARRSSPETRRRNRAEGLRRVGNLVSLDPADAIAISRRNRNTAQTCASVITPAASATNNVPRAALSPPGTTRSTVIAAVTTAIARRSMTPSASSIAIHPEHE